MIMETSVIMVMKNSNNPEDNDKDTDNDNGYYDKTVTTRIVIHW